MGDFFAPKRRDVVDRLRRRIEQYRHRHINCLGRLNVGRLGLHEQQKQDTELLHQRWLENKARKAKQSSKASNKDSGGGGGGGGNTNSSAQSEHRNLVTKLKQKIDATTTANNEGSSNTANAATNAAADNIFQFDDNNDPSHPHPHHHNNQSQPPNGTQVGSQTQGVTSAHVSGGAGVTSNVSSSTNVGVTGGGSDGSLPHLSVQIVQQISSSQRQSPQTIHTNVTVSSSRYPPPQLNSNLPHHQTQPDNNSPTSGTTANASAPQHPSAAGHGPAGNINVHTTTSTQPLPHAAGGGGGLCTNTSTTTTLGINSNNNNNSNVGRPQHNNASTDTSVHTSIECKQEPVDDVQCEVSQVFRDSGVSTPQVGGGSVPDLPYDEIQYFLESIEKDDSDLLRELKDFDSIYHKVQTQAESSGDSGAFPPLDGCDSPGLTKATANFSDQGPPHQHPGAHPPSALTPTMFESPQSMGGMVGAGMPMGHAPPPSLVEPTGPAAETLKQMAAQHQQTSAGAAPFHTKGLDSHYPDPYDPFVRSRNGYPSVYANQCYPPGYGPGGYGQSGYTDSSSPMGPYPGAKPDMTGMGYSQTKPLTHYPTDGHGMGGAGGHSGQPSGPSSLQQLQNQVASHFSPMHITQTQQVRLAQGHRHLHLSQTQQVQMAAAAAAAQQQQQLQQQGPPQGMTVSQQQTFSMGSGPPPPHMQAQATQGQPPMAMSARDMQLLQQEKMRREQQQQYMNRPPPEYKLHPGARPGAGGPPYPAAGGLPHSNNNGGSSTPLQTMQNMVNQTPPYPTSIKGEAGVCSNTGAVMTHQMSAVQSMAASGSNTGPHMTMTQASQSMSFQQQQQPVPQQRPPSYSPSTTCSTPNGVVTPTTCTSGGSAAVSTAAVVSHPSHANTTTPSNTTSATSAATSSSQQQSSGYTSALMRNQRPPNVNVGPEGLNISQPRAHPSHPHPGHPHLTPHMHPHPSQQQSPHVGGAEGGWPPRPMLQGGGSAMGPGMGQSAAIMPPGYAHRPGSTGSGMAGGGGGGVPGMHPAMMGQGMGGTQVMMHQSMQMQQQQGMAMRGGVPPTGHHPQSSMPSHSAPYPSMLGPGSMQAQASAGTPPSQQQPYPSAGLAQDDFMQLFNSEQSHNFDSLSSDLFDDILK